MRTSLRWYALVPFAAVLAACGSGPQSDADSHPRVPVEVAAAAHEPINASYSGTAALEAEHEADVAAKASGVLLKLYAEEGQRVQAGQLLAQLDPSSAQYQLAQSEARFKKAQAAYQRSEKAIQ